MSADKWQTIDVKHIDRSARSLHACSLDPSIRCLAELRASQINGCLTCTHFRQEQAEALGIAPSKLSALDAWSESDEFDEREKAALAWCESFTRFRPADPAMRKLALTAFSARELADLTMAIEMTSALSRASRRAAN
ncbi:MULTISPECIES: carboxymuconolactone decarboxylase family protein [unclassified Salinicola]|uniref:carboxymuconolactone decarboxylase family protein n=1 Tax=unclassified Salinicola TaxID=2634022 RepID=UPI001A906262|nr:MULTISPECIES: carboxymuconolactone decarboxylase family protein [unclassified Salinicola]MCE3026386.1 carboxymuconolactone decarboxylase family protein [Salinicola sp. DM10]WIX31588.1 carboxymuconolactone decarboxylase family protein [Salinicola sp. JS01]